MSGREQQQAQQRNGDNHVSFESAEAFDKGVAEWMAERIRSAVERRGHAVVGLSGGSTPVQAYTQLGAMELPWQHVHFFFVDERFVPASSKDSLRNLVASTLEASAAKQGVEVQVVHPKVEEVEEGQEGNQDVATCAKEYNEALQALFDEHGGPDLVTLGMGPDGHTASLFPELEERLLPGAGEGELVTCTTTDVFAVHDRITTTYAVINSESAERAMFLRGGEAKFSIWSEMQKVLDSGDKVSAALRKKYPVLNVMEHGLVWLTWDGKSE